MEPSTSCKQANRETFQSPNEFALETFDCLICRLNKRRTRKMPKRLHVEWSVKRILRPHSKPYNISRSTTYRNGRKKGRIIHDDDIIQKYNVYLLELNICLFESRAANLFCNVLLFVARSLEKDNTTQKLTLFRRSQTPHDGKIKILLWCLCVVDFLSSFLFIFFSEGSGK